MAVGVWQLKREHVQAWALGQINDPDAELLDAKAITDINNSRVAISLYQLACRGVARTMVGVKARPMVFGYINRNPGAVPYLRSLLPNASEHTWQSPLVTRTQQERDSQTKRVRDAIRKELARQLQNGVCRISTTTLGKQLRLKLQEKVSARVLSDAAKAIAEEGAWLKCGRTLEYIWQKQAEG